MKILIGVDNSAFSRAAVEAVADRPCLQGTAVKVISAVDTVSGSEYGGFERDENQYEIARKAIDQAFERLRQSANQFEVTGDIVEGSPKDVLLDEAEKWGADLLVVGSHGRRGLSRFLLGSVSQAVALHAKCSVEIVRSRNHQDGQTETSF